MELNKALPAARAAMKQANILTMTDACRVNAAQRMASYQGRQERIRSGDDSDAVGKFDDRQMTTGDRTITESLKEKANRVKETVMDKAHNFTESIKEKTGLGARASVGSDFQEQKEPLSKIYDQQSDEYEKKYEDAQGTNRMGAEGNLWEGNPLGAKESTASKPGYSRSTMEQVGDIVKGAKQTVTEKLGLKK